MPFEIDGITDAIGEFIDSPIIQLGLRAFLVYLIVLYFAAAFWAFKDMHGRSENPVLPYVVAAFVILFTPFFFPLAVVIYRLVRPAERIGEVNERRLAEEALLAEVEAIRTCPTCERRVHEEWIICPTCRTRLNRVCPNCTKLVGIDWSLCAWCGKDFERREVAAAEPAWTPVPAATPSPTPAPATSPTPPRQAQPGRAASSRSGSSRAGQVRTAPRSSSPRGAAPLSASDPLPER